MSAEVLQPPSRASSQHFYHDSGLRSPSAHLSSPTSSLLLERSSRPSSSHKTSPPPPAVHSEWLPVAAPSVTSSSIHSVLSPDLSAVTARHANSQLRDKPVSDESSSRAMEPSLSRQIGHDTRSSQGEPSEAATSTASTSDDSSVDDPNEIETSSPSDTTRSDSPLHTPSVVDDTAVQQKPSRQVDFLSHNWREEDIWSSWRHIVSQRKSVYGEKSRLENASWRTWAKSKNRLPTVSPEKLNWLKESDVTWLYGPLKPAQSYPITCDRSEPSSQLSRSNSFVAKKPILKKRSMSEIMLQRSISTSSLVRQAAASVQAQHRSGRQVDLAIAIDSKLHSETPSRDQIDYFTSRSTSTGGSPGDHHEKRHIRFDDVVEQCIAVDIKEIDLADGDSDVEDDHAFIDGSDSGSDDGILIKPIHRHSIRPRRTSSKGSRRSSFNERKTIETLPATTLKYRTDSPDITTEAQHHTFGGSWLSSRLSSSPSQETLRPKNPSSNFLLPNEEEEEEDVDSDSSWSFGAANPKSSLGASGRASGSRARSATSPGSRDGDYEIEGMRRTGSGMFMPYDEDEDELIVQGLFGRVSETINTARDIAHVIWNVGWRK